MWKKILFVLIFIFKWHAYILIMKWTEMNSIYNNNFNEFQNKMNIFFWPFFCVYIRWSVYVKWIVESNHHQALVTIFDKKKILKSKKNYYGQYKLLFKIHLMGNFIMYLLYHKKNYPEYSWLFRWWWRYMYIWWRAIQQQFLSIFIEPHK